MHTWEPGIRTQLLPSGLSGDGNITSLAMGTVGRHLAYWWGNLLPQEASSSFHWSKVPVVSLTRGFPSLPVMPTMNKSNGVCTSRGSMKLSWPPSPFIFSTTGGMGKSATMFYGHSADKIATKTNHIPAPSHGSDACWIFHWSDHLCLVWEPQQLPQVARF